MEQVQFWVQFGTTVLGVAFVIYQNRILKKQIDAQQGVIEAYKSHKELMDPDYFRRFSEVKHETIKAEFELEKGVMEKVLKEKDEDLENERKEFALQLNMSENQLRFYRDLFKTLNQQRYEITIFSIRQLSRYVEKQRLRDVAELVLTEETRKYYLETFDEYKSDVQVNIIEIIEQLANQYGTPANFLIQALNPPGQEKKTLLNELQRRDDQKEEIIKSLNLDTNF
jgi:hypothetical protein